MANNSPEDTEILVHVTAPSTAADDATYRQLAQAYLAFQPQTRTKLQLTEPEDATRKGKRLEKAPVANNVPTSTPQHSFEITSQDISFEGVLDNRASPNIRYAKAKYAVIPSSQDSGGASQVSWCAPASQISDSYPMPQAGLLQVSPSRVLRHYIGRPSLPQRSPSSPSPTRKRSIPPSSSSERVDVPSSLPLPLDEPPTTRRNLFANKQPIIPVTPIAAFGVQKSPGKTLPSKGTIGTAEIPFDLTHISSSVESNSFIAPSPRAGSEPPPAKRVKGTQTPYVDLVRSSSDTYAVFSSSNPALEHICGSLEIRPPSPPVGVSDIDPEDMISEKLAKLAHDLPRQYRPESKRAVDPLERGYWLLDCRAWSPDHRLKAWVFLNNYLRSGLAGWGTWCRRDEGHEWIRLYCWGHVVKHTYLLLYLASERHLKRSSAAWYDAEGELVLSVPPHDK